MTEAKLQPVSNFGDEEDYDLIGYMALRVDDEVGAGLAWEEFYRRHFPYLFGIFSREFSKVFVDLEDLATETLIRAFDKADSFEPIPEATRNIQSKHVRAWLGRIMTNLLNSKLGKYKGLSIEYPDKQNEFGEDGWARIRKEEKEQRYGAWVQRSPEWTTTKLLFQEALQTLSERERHILLVTSDYDRPDRVHQKLPLPVSSWLAKIYHTTPENIRQIRSRAKREVKKYVEEKTAKYNKENQKKE